MLTASFTRSAFKFLEKSERGIREGIFEAVANLCQDPFPAGTKRVENQQFERERVFRIRVGDYRILYTVNYDKARVLVVSIDTRARAYN